MSIIPQITESEQQLKNTINSSISNYKLGKLVSACNARKEKGIPVMNIFRYLLCIVFRYS